MGRSLKTEWRFPLHKLGSTASLWFLDRHLTPRRRFCQRLTTHPQNPRSDFGREVSNAGRGWERSSCDRVTMRFVAGAFASMCAHGTWPHGARGGELAVSPGFCSAWANSSQCPSHATGPS